jgi:L-iditol 2-dehydrogenase
MAESMWAVVKTKPGIGNVEYARVPEPACGPGQVKIEVSFTGICGTDIHVFHDRFRNYPPVILGHEFTGVVAETGAGVTCVRPGERVVVLPSSAVVCGSCEYCRQGYYMFCPQRRGMGHGINGSMTRYAVVRADMVYPLPEEVSMEEGALTEPFAAAVQAVEELTHVDVGDTVLLTGPGPIGLLCLLLLARHGCRVIVTGMSSDCARLALAQTLGASLTLHGSPEEIEQTALRETCGRGVDVAFECSGSPQAAGTCLRSLRKLGRYVQVGIMGQDISLPFDLVLYKQIQLFGSVGHSLKTWERVMRILRQREISLLPLISHKLPLQEWRHAFDLSEKKQSCKVLLCYPE